jgi:hypothetical protein
VGAHQVFDRASGTVVDEIVAALQEKVLVGSLNAAGTQDALQACVDITVRTEDKKFIAITLPVDAAVDLKGVEVNLCESNPPYAGKSVIALLSPLNLDNITFQHSIRRGYDGRGLV